MAEGQMEGTEYEGSLSVLRNQNSFTNNTSSKNKLRSNHLPPDLKLSKKSRAPTVCFVFVIKIHSSAYQHVAEETTNNQDTDCGEVSETL